MKQMRLGVVGMGMAFERLHYPALQELADRYRIVAVCDSERSKAQEWASRLGLAGEAVYTDYDEMVHRTDIDAVDVLVPIEKNAEVARAAAAAGKAVICEKPLAGSFERARAQRDLAEKFGVPVMIAENYRYNEEINILRDLVRTRKVGDIIYFMQNRATAFPVNMWKNDWAATEWRQHPVFTGGAILDYAVHDVAALRHIFGAVDKVHAFGRRQDDDFSPYAVINVNLLFKSGITGQFSFYCAGQEPQRPLVGLRLFGTKGMIYLEERDAGIINVFFNDGNHEQIPYRPRRGYYNELLNFHKAWGGEEPIAVTPEMEFGDTRTVFEILTSLDDGEVVWVDEKASFQPAYDHRPGEQPYVQ